MQVHCHKMANTQMLELWFPMVSYCMTGVQPDNCFHMAKYGVNELNRLKMRITTQ